MLQNKWNERQAHYEYLIVGSGYGGSILTARLAAKHGKNVCLLERGKEWPVGSFPDTGSAAFACNRGPQNPLGLMETHFSFDVSVAVGSGLGGTSLINANIAITPKEEVFDDPRWPQGMTKSALDPYYEKAKHGLGVGPHPNAEGLTKYKAFKQAAPQAKLLDLAIHFGEKEDVGNGVVRNPCTNCGDCVTGCNVGAKNTLYMNYLPRAKQAGAHIFTQVEVKHIQRHPDGHWQLLAVRYDAKGNTTEASFSAKHVVLAAGTLGSTKLLLASQAAHGLDLSPRLGKGFSANGDFMGFSYNADVPVNSVGFGNHPAHPKAKDPPGPTIVAGDVHCHPSGDHRKDILSEEGAFPTAYGAMAARLLAIAPGEDTDDDDYWEERRKKFKDLISSSYDDDGALNHSLMYLMMGHDDASGEIRYKPGEFLGDKLDIHWPEAGKAKIYEAMEERLADFATRLGATNIPNPVWRMTMGKTGLITAHPLGGCAMGDNPETGVTNEYGQVFRSDGNLQPGLFVADGSLVPTSLGVNPFLTISALAERIAEHLLSTS